MKYLVAAAIAAIVSTGASHAATVLDRTGAFDTSLIAGQNFSNKAIRVTFETAEAISNASFELDLDCALSCEVQVTLEGNGLSGLATEFAPVTLGPGAQSVTAFSGFDLIAASWAVVLVPLNQTNIGWVSSNALTTTGDGRASHTGTSVTDSVNPNIASQSIFSDVTGFNLNYTLSGDPVTPPVDGVIPLPAGGVLLLTALGALAIGRARRSRL